jgi:hypothetical protein
MITDRDTCPSVILSVITSLNTAMVLNRAFAER